MAEQDEVFEFGIDLDDDRDDSTRPLNLDKPINRLLFGKKLSHKKKEHFTNMFPPLLERSYDILKLSNDGNPKKTRKTFIEYGILINEDTMKLMNCVGKSVFRGGGIHGTTQGARSAILTGVSDLKLFEIEPNSETLFEYSKKIKGGKIDLESMMELRERLKI